MLPREADAAEHLHAVLGVDERGVGRERRGRRDRECHRRRLGSSRRRAPRPTPRHGRARVRASMSAQRCFTPWNWPIGRPNCTRTFAYSAAVSTHHCATPIASAASSTAARSRTRSDVETVRDDGRRPAALVDVELRDPPRQVDARRPRSRARRRRRARTRSRRLAPRTTSAWCTAEHGPARRSSATAPVASPAASSGSSGRRPAHRHPRAPRPRSRSAGRGRARRLVRAPRARPPAPRGRTRRRRGPRRRAGPASAARTVRPRTAAATRRSRRPLPAPRRAGCWCRRSAAPPGAAPRALR